MVNASAWGLGGPLFESRLFYFFFCHKKIADRENVRKAAVDRESIRKAAAAAAVIFREAWKRKIERIKREMTRLEPGLKWKWNKQWN